LTRDEGSDVLGGVSLERVREMAEWCRLQLGSMSDDDLGVREALLGRLSRGDEDNPHSSDENPKDEEAKYARLANALQEMEEGGTLAEDCIAEAEKIPGWEWGERVCQCRGCARFASEEGYKYLYQVCASARSVARCSIRVPGDCAAERRVTSTRRSWSARFRGTRRRRGRRGASVFSRARSCSRARASTGRSLRICRTR